MYDIQPPPYLSYCVPWQGCLKLSETNMRKKPQYLIGRLPEILRCTLVSQHTIIHEARSMLTSESLFRFPLVHEVIFHLLIEIILPGFWLKILSETIADVDRNFSSRSSRPEVFCKKGVLRNFTKFAGKHLCQSLFFNKVAGLRPATLLKERLWHRCFPVNFVEFLRTSFFIEHLPLAAYETILC